MNMTYQEYFQKFAANDCEEVIQYVSNAEAEEFLLKYAPRLYCPDKTIEETFAFRTWTIRKHIKKTDVGFLLTEFLTNMQLPWAGPYNTINAALTHQLNEIRWFKNANWFLDYIEFYLDGVGSVEQTASAFAYYTPALTAMYQFCVLTANEEFFISHANAFERYFHTWEERHMTKNGLYWSVDDREGTEFSISGTTSDLVMLKGFRPLMNSCMYADAISLSKIMALVGNSEKERFYRDKANLLKEQINKKLWDGEFYKAVHPLEQELDRDIDYHEIPDECNARELMGYIPFAYHVADEGQCDAFCLLKDKDVFLAETGFTTADMSNERFLYCMRKPCTWNGLVWPYATSYVINACIELLNAYHQHVITCQDLYDFIKKYAEMHYSNEDGKDINFIDEVMLPFERIWHARNQGKLGYPLVGGPNRGRDYNHSTFIDLVLRGLCGIEIDSEDFKVEPRIQGIWKWFKIENLTVRRQTYNIYYDEEGTVFQKGIGLIVERIKEDE